ncbi:hypothetical protein ACFLT4_05450 [Chloroflexota bacterium]
MLENGIPAKDLIFQVYNCTKKGDIIMALETFREDGKNQNLLIHDISFVPRGEEIIAICFFTKPG